MREDQLQVKRPENPYVVSGVHPVNRTMKYYKIFSSNYPEFWGSFFDLF